MQKIFLMSVLLATVTLPVTADISKTASTATCDSATIGATSGDANLQAAWQANTINLDFYSDGEKISTGSCTYDGAIELPEDPEDKTGYTFGGWRVKAATALPNCKAISDSTICNNTEGCSYGTGWYNSVGCKKGIMWYDSSYTSCPEITDQETCESILLVGDLIPTYSDYSKRIGPFCYWNPKTNKCASLAFGSINNGTNSTYIYGFRGTIGESWCNELINKRYDCTYNSGTCRCED